MAETTDDMATGTIMLTEAKEPKKTSWMLYLIAAGIAFTMMLSG